MTEWIVAAVIFVVGLIFGAGKLISAQTAKIHQLQSDLNGLGRKVRRQKNVDLILIAMTDDKIERYKLAALLKED